jgi:acetyl-CoA carboxylase alpha subunit
MEAAQTHVEHPNFETVWAIMQENAKQLKEIDRIIKENAERHDREMKENAERFNREMKENAERHDRQMKESADQLNKQLGKLGNRFGEMVEYMVVPNLIAKFHDLGFVFEKAYLDAEIKDKKNNIFTEVDITLENGDKVMIVEVKSKPTTENVTEHIERMEKVRRHGDLHGDKRTFLCAIAVMIIEDNVKKFALKTGFYVIEPSGETFIITAPEGEYSPREW